jgi:hypothetical protein
MKTIVLSLMVLLSTAAQATSLRPCTPTVAAQPTHITCFTKEYFYNIEIQTARSPLTPQCSGENYFESKKAKVTVEEKASGNTLANIELYNGSFSYSLGAKDVSFESPALGWEFVNCVAPVNQGGVSIGNLPQAR